MGIPYTYYFSLSLVYQFKSSHLHFFFLIFNVLPASYIQILLCYYPLNPTFLHSLSANLDTSSPRLAGVRKVLL